MSEKSIDILDLYYQVARKWKLVATVCVVVAVVTAVLNFFVIDKSYRARTVLMPPQEKSSFAGLGSLLSNVSSLPGGISRIAQGISGLSQSQFLYVVILNSRTVADSLIDKYNLMEFFDTEYRFLARRALSDATIIDFPPEGHIVVAVEVKNRPKLASDLANEYVIQLNNILSEKDIFTATRKRRFLEQRLEESHEELTELEDSLAVFQKTYGIIDPEEQAKGVVNLVTGPIKGTIEMLAELQARKEGYQIEMKTMEMVYSKEHPQMNLLRARISETDKAIGQIKKELAKQVDMGEVQSIIPVSDLPEISLAYTRLYRQKKIMEEMYLLLSAQYEEARINETDNIPNAIVLDPAIVPEYKYKPKRLLNIAIATSIALVLMVLYVVVLGDEGWLKERIDNYHRNKSTG